MYSVLRQRDFGLLWFGQLISLVGNWVLFIALPVYVFELTGSALATGLMFIVESIPPILLGPLAGVFADRWDRKWTMVIADLLRAVILLLLLFLRSADWLWVVYVVAFVESAISQFFAPAKDAFLPNVVGKEHLAQANSLNAISNNLTRLIGPALGGAALAFVGLVPVILIDCVSYLLSGILIALIATSGKPHADTPKPTASFKIVWQELVDGLRVVRESPIVRAVFIVVGITALGEGIIVVSLVPFVSTVLQGSALEFGSLASAQAIGGITAGLIIGRVSNRVKPVYLIAFGGIVNGLLLFGIFNGGALWVAIMLFVLAGFPIVALFVGINTLLQANVSDEFRGRVFGAYGTLVALIALIGQGTASLLNDRLGVVTILNFDAALYILAGLVALLLLRPLAQSPVPSS